MKLPSPGAVHRFGLRKLLRRSPSCILLLLSVLLPYAAHAASRTVSFNLSTSKTFAPGEAPTIRLYTHNVDALEFRVYRVNDPVRFLENLRELHSFGNTEPAGSGERIDERTWLERFHDWKANLWYSMRNWLRYQFSREARASLRDRQSAVSRKSRIVSAAEFAQIPLLNSNQLVARWRQQVPPTYISDANKLAVPRLDAGLYLLEATDGNDKAYTLISVTPWALITRTGSNSVLAFLVDRQSGSPVAGATIDAGFGQKHAATGVTAADGTAQLQVQGSPAEQDNFWVVAGQGSNAAITTPSSYSLNAYASQSILSYFFTERPVYRPGDTVHWKAILREKRDNLLTLPATHTAKVTITDETDQKLLEQDMPVSADGAIRGDFDVPKSGALGFYGVSIQVGDTTARGNFHVEDYRKPEYQVNVSAQKKMTLLGSSMPVTVDSRYFFGEPVANAAVKYRIYHERHYWWDSGEEDNADDSNSDATNADDADSAAGSAAYAGDVQAEKTGRLNADGKLVLQVPTTVDEKGFVHPDFDYTVEAGVTDAANREITGRGRFLATYGTFRINVEPVNYGVHVGESARFKITAIDYDDKPVSTNVHVQLVYRHYANGSTETIAGDALDLHTDADGHATGSLPIRQSKYSGAALLAKADAVVPGTRDVTDEGYLWVMGASQAADDYGGDEQTARLLADKKSYAPGDVAHLSLVSDVEGFHALILTTGSSLIKRELMSSDGRTLSFDVPITAAAQPNLTVDALFLKNNVLYQATKTLNVPPSQQKLSVSITAAKQVFQPAESATYDVLIKDAAGKPTRADLSFGVVDEAIYSLYPDSSGDMVNRLYPKRFSYAQVDNSLMFYFSGEAGTKSPMLAVRNTRYHPQLAQVKPGSESKPRVRKAFPDTAFWAPSIHSDASGHARVTLSFPDSLTTWRATVHAITASSEAGSAISRVLVRKNLLVRMGTPRFLRKGDQLVVPVVVHNYLETPVQATLGLSAKGLDSISGASTPTTVASRGEGSATWKLSAAHVGTATLTASAISAPESDAMELPIPVLPAGVAKVLAQSGVVEANATAAAANFSFPAGTDAMAHSLHIEVSPSIAGSLFSALDYLASFPYGCTEQTMSSFLPNVIVQQTMQRLGLTGHVDADALRTRMNAGLARLKDYQHDDGGWGWWKEDGSLVFMTAYVVSGLAQAGDAIPLRGPEGYAIMLQRGRQYLEGQLGAHPRMRPELRAAVVYALAQGQSGNNDPRLKTALDAQWSRRSDLDAESLAMTGLAMLQVRDDDRAAQISKLLESKAQQAGDLVHWPGNYVPMLDAEYQNDTEATAFSLRLLSRTDPQSQLLPAAAQWLMLGRDGGSYWESTEQTAMVVFGMTEYLAASKELQGDFTARVAVNGSTAGERHFTAEDILNGASLTVDLDATHLQPGNNTVQITRQDGSGHIYWSTAPKFYSTDKADYQSGKISLNLTRDYYRLQPVQKDGKVLYSMQPIGNSTVHIGDVLAVHEAIDGSPMRYMMLEDPIAAGTEFISNTDAYPIDGQPDTWYAWYTRREFRDDRAVFFVSDFSGRQEVCYLVKVVNPGTFHVSPARVAPMYQHGVQATSDQLLLTIPAPGATEGAP
jgi:uncharacterized protein YfaS (alpha-2-macroglobulin family)